MARSAASSRSGRSVGFDIAAHPWPFFAKDEIRAAEAVLESGKVNYWTGTEGRQFEREFAEAFDARYAVAMANGTVTLQACLRALGIGPGDEVVTTPRTFIGTSSAIVMEGALPVMADVDADSGNITAATIERVLTQRTRAILPVHLAGWPCEMDEIAALVDHRGLFVIEDCAQAHGAMYRGRPVGSFGDLASWSFCQDKIMTTGGEGGMVTTNYEGFGRAVWSMKDHGKSYRDAIERPRGHGFQWLHDAWGTNWRMTEMQAAIGRCQLRKLPEWSAIRRRNAHVLEELLRPFPALRVPEVPAHIEHAYYKLYAYVRPEALKPDWTRDRIMEELQAHGVPGLSGSCSEIYLERAFTTSGYAPAQRLPVARNLGETSLMFLVHPTLTENAVREMGAIIAEVVAGATK